jgi:hypothetical protein
LKVAMIKWRFPNLVARKGPDDASQAVNP